MFTRIVAPTLTLAFFSGLTACSNASKPDTSATTVKTENATAQTKTAQADQYQYIKMDKFNRNLATFIGFRLGENIAQSTLKINAVFKAYDGHADPLDISTQTSVVEAGWKQVLVTQDGLMDGTVTGQQLLAIFDDSDKLISYGMRIKCHSETADAMWQSEVCDT